MFQGRGGGGRGGRRRERESKRAPGSCILLHVSEALPQYMYNYMHLLYSLPPPYKGLMTTLSLKREETWYLSLKYTYDGTLTLVHCPSEELLHQNYHNLSSTPQPGSSTMQPVWGLSIKLNDIITYCVHVIIISDYLVAYLRCRVV